MAKLNMEGRRPYLLWLGPVLPPEEVVARRAASPAANGWQRSLIGALSHTIPVQVIGHVPEPVFPGGRALVHRGSDSGTAHGNLHVGYANVPFVRTRSLSYSYQRATDQFVEKHGAPAAVLTYNDSAWNVAAASGARRWGSPWVCIVADAPGAGPALLDHQQRIYAASGRIFLSYGRFRDSRRPPAIHLDGGVDGLRFDPTVVVRRSQGPSVVLFSGALNRWAGAAQLINAFRHVRFQDAELWICGHGRNPDVDAAAAGAARVRLLGMLSQEELAEAQARADVFVNPRPPELVDNRSNFPSKVLEYLTWGRPVVSTWTDGLAPEYAGVLQLANSSSPHDLADAIDRALAMSDHERSTLSRGIGDFLSTRLWPRQATRLLDWLATDIGADIPQPMEA